MARASYVHHLIRGQFDGHWNQMARPLKIWLNSFIALSLEVPIADRRVPFCPSLVLGHTNGHNLLFHGRRRQGQLPGQGGELGSDNNSGSGAKRRCPVWLLRE